MPKVIFSNETPNDQGGIIINKSIKFERFNANPIMLYQHGYDREIGDMPIGHWEDITFNGTGWEATPVFSDIYKTNKKIGELKKLFEEGNLKGASIGAVVVWKKTNVKNSWGDYVDYKNDDGLRISETVILYEISLVSLPSNKDAVSSIKLYSENEITELNSKYMAKQKQDTTNPVEPGFIPDPQPEKHEETENKTITEEQKPEKVQEKPDRKQPKHVILQAWDSLLQYFGTDVPMHKEPDGDEPVQTPAFPTKENPVSGVEKPAKLESEAEGEGEGEAEKLYKIEGCSNEAELEAIEQEYSSEMPPVIKKAIEKKKSTFVKNNSIKINKTMPEMKTKEELAGEKIAPIPTNKIEFVSGTPLTTLMAKEDGAEIVKRLQGVDGRKPQANEHAIFLNALLSDPKFAVLHSKDGHGNGDVLRFFDGGKNTKPLSLQNLAQMANNGNFVKLTSADDLLTTPVLTAVEWLSLVLFKLFPSTSWKAEIPLFGVTETGNNLGLIWTNIAANPGVTRGAKPTQSAYEYTDTSVSLTMHNFWLQEMLWTPLNMHLLRYDQMGTGWAQALNAFNYYIDKVLIYTLSSIVPAASIIKTTGSSSFTIAASTDIDAFALNTAFAGTLAKPSLTDILTISQLFRKQNYPDGFNFVTVMDPTMDKYITDDPNTKSLLTRFVNSMGDELVGYKNAKFRVRSEVALYDPETTFIDPTGVIPATSVSSGLAFIPDQIGIGLGKFDVFMVQRPDKYGYSMSADIRMGINALRSDFKGLAAYTYAVPNV